MIEYYVSFIIGLIVLGTIIFVFLYNKGIDDRGEIELIDNEEINTENIKKEIIENRLVLIGIKRALLSLISLLIVLPILALLFALLITKN